MRVRARQFDPADVPVEIELYLHQHFVTTGHEYDVQALAIFEGHAFYQIVDDLPMPAWREAWAFDLVDSAIPADWICSVFQEQPRLVLGPPFLAESIEAYETMVELHPEQVLRFWRRLGIWPSELTQGYDPRRDPE